MSFKGSFSGGVFLFKKIKIKCDKRIDKSESVCYDTYIDFIRVK